MEAAVEAAAAGVVVAVAAAEGAAADEGTQGRPQRAPMTRRRKRKAGPFAAACWVRPGSRFVKRRTTNGGAAAGTVAAACWAWDRAGGADCVRRTRRRTAAEERRDSCRRHCCCYCHRGGPGCGPGCSRDGSLADGRPGAGSCCGHRGWKRTREGRAAGTQASPCWSGSGGARSAAAAGDEREGRRLGQGRTRSLVR